MKSKCEEKIVRLEAQLKGLKDQANAKTEVSNIVDEALKRFKKLAELYSNGDIEAKRYIIGSIFPEKWTISEIKVEPVRPILLRNLSTRLTTDYHIKKPKLELTPAWYPAPESNRHGFPQVFETSASTNSASWAFVLDGVANVDNESLNHKIIFN